MKITRIPAQITTVEDRIAGNLTLTQIMLLLTPLFILVFIYAILPEKLHFTLYKIPLIIFFTLFFFILAVRIKDRIVLHWIGTLSSYYFRPSIYIYNKNNLVYREYELTEPNSYSVQGRDDQLDTRVGSIKETLQSVIAESQTPVHIKFRNGGLDVISH